MPSPVTSLASTMRIGAPSASSRWPRTSTRASSRQRGLERDLALVATAGLHVDPARGLAVDHEHAEVRVAVAVDALDHRGLGHDQRTVQLAELDHDVDVHARPQRTARW